MIIDLDKEAEGMNFNKFEMKAKKEIAAGEERE